MGIMDVRRFIEALGQLNEVEKYLVNSILVKYALKKEEPTFTLIYEIRFGRQPWVLVFDDVPDTWLKIFEKRSEGVDFCAQHDLKLSRVGNDFRH